MTPIMDVLPVGGRQLNIRVDDSPREVLFEVGLDIRESEPQAQLCLRLDVVLDEVTQTDVLAASLEIASTLPVQEMHVEGSPVTVLPTDPNVLQDCLDESRIVIGCVQPRVGTTGQSESRQDGSHADLLHQVSPAASYRRGLDDQWMALILQSPPSRARTINSAP